MSRMPERGSNDITAVKTLNGVFVGRLRPVGTVRRFTAGYLAVFTFVIMFVFIGGPLGFIIVNNRFRKRYFTRAGVVGKKFAAIFTSALVIRRVAVITRGTRRFLVIIAQMSLGNNCVFGVPRHSAGGVEKFLSATFASVFILYAVFRAGFEFSRLCENHRFVRTLDCSVP